MRTSFLMGLVGGQRAMTPLAAVCVASAQGLLPAGNGAPAWMAHPLAAPATMALALAELAADKLPGAPDRVAPLGLAARFCMSALAGMALASRRDRWAGAALGGAVAVVASYAGWRTRSAATRAFGPVQAGLLEDAAVLAGAVAIVRPPGQRRPYDGAA